MIARFDHHPMLTALLALSTAVLVVVVITLATLLITLQPAASPASYSGANPAAVSGTGSSYYAEDPNTVAFERHPQVVAALSE